MGVRGVMLRAGLDTGRGCPDAQPSPFLFRTKVVSLVLAGLANPALELTACLFHAAAAKSPYTKGLGAQVKSW